MSRSKPWSPRPPDSEARKGSALRTVNPDCTQCDFQASPVAAGTVGAFTGAFYHHCGAYRPEYDCRMRTLGQPFCAVCRQRILDVLAPFASPPPVGDFPTPDPDNVPA